MTSGLRYWEHSHLETEDSLGRPMPTRPGSRALHIPTSLGDTAPSAKDILSRLSTHSLGDGSFYAGSGLALPQYTSTTSSSKSSTSAAGGDRRVFPSGPGSIYGPTSSSSYYTSTTSSSSNGVNVYNDDDSDDGGDNDEVDNLDTYNSSSSSSTSSSSTSYFGPKRPSSSIASGSRSSTSSSSSTVAGGAGSRGAKNLDSSTSYSSSSSSSTASRPHQLEWKFKSKLAIVPYRLVTVTAEEITHGVKNICTYDRSSYWSVSSGVNHEIVIELALTSLVGYVQITNKCTSSIEIAVALSDNKRDAYVTVRSDPRMPHNKPITYNAGFLPARYIRLRMLRGTPVSLYSVKILGLPASEADRVGFLFFSFFFLLIL